MKKNSSSTKLAVAAVVPAAGSGKRLGARRPKPLVRIGGVPLFVRTLRALSRSWPFRRIVMAVDPDCAAEIRRELRAHGVSGVELVHGGSTRAESVRNGLGRLDAGDEIVLVHDVARPFVTKRDVERVIREAGRTGGAILALRATATVKEADPADRRIRKTHDRARIWLAQTPQVFRTEVLRAAYAKLGRAAARYTDEAGLVEAAGGRVNVVEGSAYNLKITAPEDLKLADALMGLKLIK